MLRRLAAVAGLAAIAAVSGCATTVHLEPAPRADDPLCAEVSVRMPDTVAGLERHWTDAQATAVWGDPTAVILTCGLEALAPTTEQCVTIDGVDWVVDETDRPNLRMTTYGREPAVQVYVDTTVVTADSVLAGSALGGPVSTIPKTTQCTDPDTADPDVDDAPTTESDGD
ncbi:hypothetical protein GCM10022219_09270 [Microbacterium oryzae]|uniref:DUF3515 family protein n=1 Tax=Microbacterium oryzae TaxID=743009 RepID=A0A6I6DYE2_9MICO|nr:DUF3515 family protein [Microbacterium oryzae]QGU26994.1 DUF3515 family protein [Microbacterium oryzae]